MTDCELLELAAKAADYIFTEKLTESAQGKRTGPFISHRKRWKQWNPLKDDGDALRLAVDLGLIIEAGKCWHSKHGPAFGEDLLIGEMAATRRAIVRATADIVTGK